MASGRLLRPGAEQMRLKLQVGDDQRQHDFVGDDHQHHADARSDAQFVNDGNIDQHDHPEAQGIHQQCQGAGDEYLAEGGLGRTHRIAARQNFLLPGIGHLHRVGYANREDQKRHQNRHRVDPKAQ